MALRDDLRGQVLAVLDGLPDEAVREVLRFVEYQQYKVGEGASSPRPYTPVALGGLWEGVRIDEEDIAEVRREMWGGLRG